MYVIVVILFAHTLGSGTMTAIFVTSQLITSIILDLNGTAGFPQRHFSWQRVLGATLLIAGTLLVSLFPGALVMKEADVKSQDVEVGQSLELAQASQHKQP
jgi:hypothetical protein